MNGQYFGALAAKVRNKETRMNRSGILVLLLSVSWFAAMAQQGTASAPSPAAGAPKALVPPTPQMAEQAARQDGRHITLNVIATDAQGKPVPGLQQQDFTILDNKQPQTMTSFAAVQGATADPPTEVILLIDTVNTTFQRVAFVRQQVDAFLRRNGGHLAYPTRLVLFSENGTQIEPEPTRDGNGLVALLDSNKSGLRIVGRSAGFYGAEERLQLSWKTMDQLIGYAGQKPGRKMLLWISPGWPMLSGPRVEFTSREQQSLFNSIVTFTNALRTSQVTLYAVNPLGSDESVLRTSYYQDFLNGVRKSQQANPGNLALQVLAVQSGGRVLNANNDLTGLLQSCVDDASAYYVMSFEAVPADRADEYHALSVKVDKPGIKTLTNAAYYSKP
jgi:VWFA-related protein